MKRKILPDPVNSGTLTWHHTEFGRGTDCDSYHAMRCGDDWRVLDRDWNYISGLVKSLVACQEIAEKHKARQEQREKKQGAA